MESNEELKQKYNPEGSALRKQQYRMLEMLEVLDRICEKHHLSYWLEGGTLLGAVRHGGFIPWDDDLDVQMMRADYKKLLKILPSELPDNLVLQTTKTDRYFCKACAKLRDLESKVELSCPFVVVADTSEFQGIFIDILPVEFSGFKCLKKLAVNMHWYLFQKWQYRHWRSNNMKKEILRITHSCAQLFFSLARFFAKFKKNNEISYFNDYKINCTYEDIFPLTKIEFEGKKFNAPCHVDTFLRNYFGEDYKSVPPEDKRECHTLGVEFLDRR